ncbi:hypothetical protein M3Y96_00897300 [Aphelenchoides besseyi]|nr:hypothetical protein M3Y96_00897300 [Aphelenchoides besseyi]
MFTCLLVNLTRLVGLQTTKESSQIFECSLTGPFVESSTYLATKKMSWSFSLPSCIGPKYRKRILEPPMHLDWSYPLTKEIRLFQHDGALEDDEKFLAAKHVWKAFYPSPDYDPTIICDRAHSVSNSNVYFPSKRQRSQWRILSFGSKQTLRYTSWRNIHLTASTALI